MDRNHLIIKRTNVVWLSTAVHLDMRSYENMTEGGKKKKKRLNGLKVMLLGLYNAGSMSTMHP